MSLWLIEMAPYMTVAAGVVALWTVLRPVPGRHRRGVWVR